MALDLTLSSAVFAASAGYGSALSGGSASITASPLPTAGTFTFEARVTTTATALNVAFGQATAGWMGLGATGFAEARYGSGATEVKLSTTAGISDGLPHHLALVMSASGGLFFVDGILRASSATTTTGAACVYTSPLEIRTYSGSFAWVGTVDECAISNFAKYTNSFTPAPVRNAQAGLVVVYHLDGDGLNGSTAVAGSGPGVPSAPSVLASNNQVIVDGPAPASAGSAAITGYTIYRNGSATALATNVALPYIDATAANGTAYTYTRAAVSSVDTGPLSTASPSVTPPSGGIAPNHPAIFYSGSWLVNSIQAKTINSGQYFRVLVPAGTIALNFNLSGLIAPLPQIVCYLNGQRVLRTEIAASVAVPIDTSISTQLFYLLEVVVAATTELQSRWSPQATAVGFTGLTLSSAVAPRLPSVRPYQVLFYGDSITEGVRTLAATAASGKDTDRSDATGGNAYSLRHHLAAEIDVVGFGGSGVGLGGSGGVPSLVTSYGLLWSGQARDFTTRPPDLIILNEGTNDGTNNITTSYTAVLNSLLAATPAATKILCLRPINGTSQAANIQAAVAACSAPGRVTYGDTAGVWAPADSTDALHPYAYANVGFIAPAIANLARPLLPGVVPTGLLPIGKSQFKFTGPAAVNISGYPGLAIVRTLPAGGEWGSGTPAGPGTQYVNQFVPGNQYYVLNTSAAAISLLGAQL